jgi:acetylornithine deacetylase/succinyl-diaminopimelate desuccinylase-like protein
MVACAGADLEELARKGEAIWFIGSMGEETGNNGARASLEVLPEWVWRTIALEPTEAAVVHASKGFAVLEVDIEGRSAHGSNPEVGLNAIYGAQVFTDRLRTLCEREGARYGSELTGRPSVNLGLIRGGIAANVVAPRCHLEFDWRTVPPETIGEVKEKIGALLESMKEEGVILGWEMRQQQNNEALWTSGDSGLVRELSAALQAAGLEGRKAGVRWCCDASIYCPRSDETVIFGPGSIRQGHATEEFIDVDELRRGTDGLGRLWPRRSS